jgi:hypothetical protein
LIILKQAAIAKTYSANQGVVGPKGTGDRVYKADCAAAPDELGLARDPRVLGVAIRRLILRQGTHFHVMEAEDERLSDGFHAFETDNAWRWTNGGATVPPTLYERLTGPVELVLQIGAVAR